MARKTGASIAKATTALILLTPCFALSSHSAVAAPTGPAAASPASSKTVTVLLDSAISAPGSVADVEPTASSPSLDPWKHWAHLDENATPSGFTVTSGAMILGQATRFAHGQSAMLTNASDGPITLRVGARLDTGLWRVEAALASASPALVAPQALSPDAGGQGAPANATNASAAPVPVDATPAPVPQTVRMWRMESVFLANGDAAYKSVHLGPGETLIVRWTDTLAEADSACWSLRHMNGAQGGPKTYTGMTVSKALSGVADLIGQMEVVTARGKRDDVVKRAQNALLLVAQAQAMARNGAGGSQSLGDSDAIFNRLTGTLSEISCAACNLIPAETIEMDAKGVVTGIRVSVTNGGARTIPSVSLALPQPGDGNGLDAPGTERTVFRGLAPGATVTAHFSITPTDSSPAPTVARGIVQFILGMGAAVVPTGPVP